MAVPLSGYSASNFAGAADVSEQLYLKQGYICGGIIPHYARSATGVLDDTAIFYKVL